MVRCDAPSLFTSVTARAAMESHSGLSLYSSFQNDVFMRPEKEFILALEQHPLLWQRDHVHYTNRIKRNESLKELLPILKKVKPDATIYHVRMKINSLRSNYRRELKKVLASKRSGVPPDEVYSPKSWSYKDLGFLYEHETITNEVLDSGEADEYQSDSRAEAEVTYDSDNASHGSAVYFEYAMSPSQKVKRQKIGNQNDPLDSTSACPVSPQPSTSVSFKEPKANSSNYIAFEWAETLNRLDPLQRIYAKKAINDILFEAELGNLNRIKNDTFES